MCVRDLYFGLFDYIESGMLDLESQTPEESLVLQKECWICGAADGLMLHPIAGKLHDYRTVTVCDAGAQSCHRVLLREQTVWDARWWKPGQPPHLRHAFFLLGLRSILLLKSLRTENYNYERLADWLTSEISKCLRQEV
jgi:hypothetical protein